jgi:hypothetical protein
VKQAELNVGVLTPIEPALKSGIARLFGEPAFDDYPEEVLIIAFLRSQIRLLKQSFERSCVARFRALETAFEAKAARTPTLQREQVRTA